MSRKNSHISILQKCIVDFCRLGESGMGPDSPQLRARHIRVPRAFFLALALAGCAPFPATHDHGPGTPVDVSQVPDAVPGDETPSRYGNPASYTVLGKSYSLVPSCKGYHERGIASWYGTQFHGGRTSDGETYDMYTMSAANKVVPIPCYARVTNLVNGKSVIVKINDRGPFVDNRVIDLSYAAASRLGMLGTGTALVDVQAVSQGETATPPAAVVATAPTPETPPVATPLPAPATTPVATIPAHNGLKIYLQVGAYVERSNAEAAVARLGVNAVQHAFIEPVSQGGRTLYKVRIGPLPDVTTVDSLSARLAALGYPDAEIVIP